jgi:hypothetical protein
MKQPENTISELSGYQIRAAIARLGESADGLEEWRFEFEEWRRAYVEFQRMEKEQIIDPESPSELALRRHRYVLFLLMAQGERLALSLINDDSLKHAERARLIESLDAFLGSLRDSWQTWHGEALPEHRRALAQFLT